MSANINIRILKKINEKVDGDEVMKRFLIEILNKENSGMGHYSKPYKEAVERAMEEGNNEV